MARKKPEIVTDDQHTLLIDWVNQAETSNEESQETGIRCRAYYDSEQWTPEEVRKLKRRGQAATVINRIKPKMDTLMGMEKAAKTTAKAYPRNPSDEHGAEAVTESVRFVLQDNHFDQTRSSCWENGLIEGTFGCEIDVKETKDKKWKIVINHIMWDRLVWDPHSRRKDFSDARFLGQVKWMDYDEAEDTYPNAKEILDAMKSGTSVYDDQPRWMDNKRKRVKIVQLYYYKANGEVWTATFTRGGFCESPKISPFVDEEGQTEWPYEFGSLFVKRDGSRYGAVLQLLDPQDDLNKRRSKFQHLLSVRQIRLERGAVEDVNKVRQELAKPDGVVETTPGMEFEVLKTGDMATAQFQLYQDSKMEMDIVGANSAIQGKGAADESGVALRTRQQAGQTEIGPMFDVLRYWQLRVFRKTWNRIKQYWTDEMWVRVSDDIANVRFVALNKPITKGQLALEQAQVAGTSPEELQLLQARIQADPAMQEKATIRNNLPELDMDIEISEVPDVLTQQQEDFTAMSEMVKSGLPIPAQAVIEASPLANKEKILKIMREQPQLPPQVQEQMKQMQEAMQKTQEQAQQLAQENQQLKMDQSADMAKINAQAQTKQAEGQMDMQLRREQAALERQTALDEAKLKADTAIEVARINSKQKMTEAAMQAELDTNLDLIKQIKGEPGPDGQPVEPVTPLQQLAGLHQQSMDQHQEGMTALSTMLAQAFQGLNQTLQSIQQSNVAILEELKRPKSVSLGNVRRDNGQISGASVSIQ